MIDADGQGGDARPRRPALPHGARQGVERPPSAVGVPRDLLVSDHPGAEPGGGVLGRARELQRVDQVRRDDRQRHVPAARTVSPRPPRRSASAPCCPTTSPTTSTTSTRSRTTGSPTSSPTAPRTAGSRSTSGSSGSRSPRRPARRTPACSPTTSTPGIHIHLNESLTEVENSKERFGRRPTEVAYDCGILFDRCIAAHCVWLSDKEIALMRETGTQISHNPSSNAKLGNGIARVPEMLAAGHQRRARSRRRRVQQQPGPVRGDEVRVADAPREPGGSEPAAGAGRRPDGHAQRVGGAAATRPVSSRPARRPT